jgi:hypothetical protein
MQQGTVEQQHNPTSSLCFVVLTRNYNTHLKPLTTRPSNTNTEAHANYVPEMSENATEVVYIPIKPGLDLSSGETKETWESTLNTIAKQPGVKALYWGRQIESPDTVQMLVGA